MESELEKDRPLLWAENRWIRGRKRCRIARCCGVRSTMYRVRSVVQVDLIQGAIGSGLGYGGQLASHISAQCSLFLCEWSVYHQKHHSVAGLLRVNQNFGFTSRLSTTFTKYAMHHPILVIVQFQCYFNVMHLAECVLKASDSGKRLCQAYFSCSPSISLSLTVTVYVLSSGLNIGLPQGTRTDGTEVTGDDLGIA
ncbi:hypothetical protein Ddye_032169 [Dipteronia dyeriana]|uniref:Uncharacterized protein n=1 Tax=Dipteronia dyeriana TaxID=168575 RepID=A0AAD9TKC5_9ROSI|nr:hypothetical protein Ddye_032169 [Dipteronia dyeriana]